MVIGSSNTRTTILKGSQSREWTSFIECVSADGRLLDPGIIFKGKALQEQWFTKEVLRLAPNWRLITSPKGWTNHEIGLKWLEEVFDQQTRPEDESEARLLIMDGHKSHTQVILHPVTL